MTNPDDIQKISDLVTKVAQIGANNPLKPPIDNIKAFEDFFSDGKLDIENLDVMDGCCTRREILARFLLLCAVLDQGPDISGIRDLLSRVTNELYEKNIRIFHAPLDFFKEMQISIDQILKNHETIKTERAKDWADKNETTEGKYNLFMDGGKQSLSYAIFRWGVPLALPYVLGRKSGAKASPTTLLDYLETWESAEKMSQEIKDHNIYGLGKAIGDKACHLYAKWIVSSFSLSRHKCDAWGKYSFEVPYDSNAGRVLWRTGYLLRLANEDEYKSKQVVNHNKGKHDKHYIRVTNIRGMKISCDLHSDIQDDYRDLCVNHLKTHKRGPKTIEIQRLQHVFLMNSEYGVAEFDDGLIHVGREYCHNHKNPDCKNCPLKNICEGFNKKPELIEDYRT